MDERKKDHFSPLRSTFSHQFKKGSTGKREEKAFPG
jgi:hypothetical protein